MTIGNDINKRQRNSETGLRRALAIIGITKRIMDVFDLIIVGGGVVGCSTARAVLTKNPKLKICILEAEPQLSVHQSGRNSGVVHVGYNQKPGSVKAKFVVEGSRKLREFCKKHNVPVVEDGIVVVARDENELKTVEELHKRGTANGARVELIDKSQLRKLEPCAVGLGGLFAPEGASFDSKKFVHALGDEAVSMGAHIALAEKVVHIEELSAQIKVRTNKRVLHAKALMNAAGLHADRLAHMIGAGLDYQIIPFRGEYHQLVPEKRAMVRAHVYAPPDLNFPFLGVHFSRTFDGHVTIGPGAVLALGRHSYEKTTINPADVCEMLGFPGFWRLFGQSDFRKMAKLEWQKSLFKKAVFKEAQQLIPDITYNDLVPYRSGIRAQVIAKDGRLVEDLVVEETPLSVHVLNAVSPALTCSLPFAEHLASLVEMKLG